MILNSESHPTGGSIGNRLLVIYKHLLALNTIDGLPELYDAFHEMKYKLLNDIYLNAVISYPNTQ